MRWRRVNIILITGLLALTGCSSSPDGDSDTGLDGGKDAGDAGIQAPVITGIDGDGTDLPIVCPGTGPCTGNKAKHRFRSAWVISGLGLDTVTDVQLKGGRTFGPADGLKFEDGGTSMSRKLILPITLISGLFTLTLANSAGEASAETYILQGERGAEGAKGDPGDSFFNCVGNDCTAGKNLIITGLKVTDTYDLPGCPAGYTVASAPAGVLLCVKGADEMVKVGSFWIDKYEASIVDSTQYAGGDCSGAGVPFGQSSYDYPGTFPRTGNWTDPMYACSIRGVKPSAYMTWFQAQEACALSGKELCTNEQWQAAAAGTYDTTGTETGTQCHIATTNTSARNTGLAGAVPGGADSCMSKWGAEDMIGNQHEWVAMWGQASYDNGITGNGVSTGSLTSGNGFANFAPEMSGLCDETSNIAGAAYGCDSSGDNCGYKVGLPFAALRGGCWRDGSKAGVYTLIMYNGPSTPNFKFGFRCCRAR